MNSWVRALKRYIRDVPHRIIMVGVARLNLLRKMIIAVGIIANTNALITTPPPASSSIPRMRASAAPNPAPEDIPMVYGSARGFFRMLCMATPQIANATPHTIAPRILGNLSCRTTCAASASVCGMLIRAFHRMWYTSEKVRGYGPRVMAYMDTNRQANMHPAMNSTL